MNDDMNEKLSAFIDNEMHDKALIDEIIKDDQARETMVRYQLITDVLKKRYVAGSLNIADKVHQRLQEEATIITPRRWFRKSSLTKQVAGLAVAATVAAVSILIVSDFSPSVNESQQVAVGQITDQPVRMTSAMQNKLNGYLVSHNEFSASGQFKGMLPYTRIASSAQGERIAVKAKANAGVKLEK